MAWRIVIVVPMFRRLTAPVKRLPFQNAIAGQSEVNARFYNNL
jgi:hypothetical protein